MTWGEVEKEGGGGGGRGRGDKERRGREGDRKERKKENNDLRENLKRDTWRKTKWESTSEECDLSLLSFGEVTVRNKLEMTFLLLCMVDDLHVS